jgi:hypothetical protein
MASDLGVMRCYRSQWHAQKSPEDSAPSPEEYFRGAFDNAIHRIKGQTKSMITDVRSASPITVRRLSNPLNSAEIGAPFRLALPTAMGIAICIASTTPL